MRIQQTYKLDHTQRCFLLILLCVPASISSNAQFFLTGEQIYNSDTIGLYHSITVFNNFALNNVGHIKIHAEYNAPALITLNQTYKNYTYLGSGSIELAGDQTFDLDFNRVYLLGHINFNNGTKDCWVNDQGFEADSSIILNSSRLIIEEDEAFVKLNNDHIDALVFNNTPNTETYIIGRLVRNMAATGRYYYPVGNESKMFLIDTESSQSQSVNISVRFNDQLVNGWLENNLNYKASDKLAEGGWEIDNWLTKTNDSPLNLTIYKYSFSNLYEDGTYRIAYFDSDQYPNTEPILSEETLTVNTTEFVSADFQKPNGYYTLFLDEGLNLNEIPNFVVGVDGYNYHFSIPGVFTLVSASLEVYNSWGYKVYNESNYLNQLDTRSLPQGTYYYVFKYDKGEGEKVYQSFFEVYK